MSRAFRCLLVLVLGLGLLTVGASYWVNATTRAWFSRDLELRAQLAVNGAQKGLLGAWTAETPQELEALLTDITLCSSLTYGTL